MAAACAPSSALALACVLIALFSTRPDEDEGTRADAADGILGEADRRRAAAGRHLSLILGSLEKGPHLSRACMSEECSARSAIAAGVQNKDARWSKEGGDGLEDEVAGDGDGENLSSMGCIGGEGERGAAFNLIKGKSMHQLSQSTDRRGLLAP